MSKDSHASPQGPTKQGFVGGGTHPCGCFAQNDRAGCATGNAATPAKPELLAPAGNYEAFLAALTAGADAIYVGAKDFNARRNAGNFDFETLAEACDLAHIADRRVYLTLNTMILPDETGRALDVARRAWDAGIDALIVQDLGLLALLSREMPQFELHASTQMNLHSTAGVRLADELGASRVTLARELSLDELGTLAQEGVPLEVFAHGALCVCYSGQCLFSSLVGRRSANRGLCAQACRLPYRLIDTSTGRPIATPGEHLLSPADLATIDILPALVKTGVASLKIEGRMKSAVYVAATTRAYRRALDELFATADGDGTVADGAAGGGARSGTGVGTASEDTTRAETGAADADKQVDPLAETFSRGFTTAYLEGRRGNDMMSYARPNNRGVAVGRVGTLTGGMVSIDLTQRVSRGDVLEFWTSRGRVVTTLEEFWDQRDGHQGRRGAGGGLDQAAAGTRVYLRVAEPVSTGDRVFRVRSAELLDGVKPLFDHTVFQGNNGIAAVAAQVILRQGERAEISFSVRREGRSKPLKKSSFSSFCAERSAVAESICAGSARMDTAIRLRRTQHDGTFSVVSERSGGVRREGRSGDEGHFGDETHEAQPVKATAFGDVVEDARTKPLTTDDIREHVGRIGGTPFSIDSWDIQLDAGVGMGFSSLHRLRNEALEALTGELLKDWRQRAITPCEKPPALAPARKGKPRVAAIVRDSAGARAAVQGGAELIYLHSLRFEITGEADAEGLPSAGKLPSGTPVIRLLPAVTHDRELDLLNSVIGDKAAAVVNNLGELELLRHSDCALEAGASLGICNGETLDLCARLDMTQAWLSPELSYQDIMRIAPSAPVPLALTVSGRQELMVTEHCVLMAQGPCNQRCASCVRRKTPRLLEDRKGYRLPVRTDDYGRGHLFNAVPLDLIPSMPELVSLGLSTLVVDGTLMTTRELKAEVERAVRARDLALRGTGSLPKHEGYTSGHFFRGVW